jgi:ankyrin repeat protein
MSRQTSDINGSTITGKPLLVAACENALAMEKICLMLLEQGADVNVTDRVYMFGSTLLFNAHIFQETGKTVLHAACAAGSVRVVRELLQRGANVNARDSQQQTPAHAAITSKVFEVNQIFACYQLQPFSYIYI